MKEKGGAEVSHLKRNIVTEDGERFSAGDVPLFKVEGLSLSFRRFQKRMRENDVCVIRNMDLTINAGEIVAIVGASGSGKSLLANAVLGLLPKNAVLGGSIYFQGEVLTPERLHQLRGKEMILIPQSVQALDPLMPSAKQVQSVIRSEDKQAVQRDIFAKVGLPQEAGDLYPFELSGGMSRRVLASIAMASQAKLVIADEPTPGLDEKALQEVLDHIKLLAKQGRGMMFITHDISAALQIADQIAVFYAGETIELANVQDFEGRGGKLRHPYTRALWRSLPQNDFVPLAGSQPVAGEYPSGCAFHPRCPLATELCQQQIPELRQVSGGWVRCFYA